MSIGERILKLRKAAGMTQEQLAEKLGVSRQTVSKWEVETSIPDLEKIVQISRIFAVSLDDLVREEGEVVSGDSHRLTIEDIIKLNNHHRKMMLIVVSGAIFLMIGIISFLVISIVNSAIVSVEYMLYRYIAVGEYAYAPADYTKSYIAAALCGIIGIGLMTAYKIKQRRDK